jgi:thioredoxin reductase (NADPH)
MAGPMLMAVDDDPGMLGRIERELRRRYGADYEVVCASSASAGLAALERIRAAGGEVAVVLADVWLPEMTGVDFLTRAHLLHPSARRVLLASWGDRSQAPLLLRGAALGQVDDWLAKPWQPADEHFHQGVSAFLYEWARRHRPGFEAIRVVGQQWSARSHEIRDVLSRNSVLFSFHAADSEEGRALLEEVGASGGPLPVLVLFDGQVLADPSNAEIAAAMGIKTQPERSRYDVVIVGAGPAGLAAAVYAASEGLRTVVLEQEAIGGQAGSSSMIRNYLGFPRGVSGTELAVRAFQQAGTFGADFVYGRAAGLRAAGPDRLVTLEDGAEVSGRTVVVATGVSYRRLGIPTLDALTGMGVFYGAATAEAQAMADQDVYVVGGANSAGQAAVHLARYAARVTMVVRRPNLAETMSDYLVRQVQTTPNITVLPSTEVLDGHGDGHLTGLVLADRASGTSRTVPATALFVLIGAQPHTAWLPAAIQRDRNGFIRTCTDLVAGGPADASPRRRPPLPFETSMPGVFAVGDVRAGSIKRVASSVGEGSVVIRLLHDYLAGA